MSELEVLGGVACGSGTSVHVHSQKFDPVEDSYRDVVSGIFCCEAGTRVKQRLPGMFM